MIKISTTIFIISSFLSGCFSDTKEIIKENRIDNNSIKINYYSDKSVTSLEIPPDLTSPSYENSFRISNFVQDIKHNTISLSDADSILESDQKVLNTPEKIEIKTAGNRKWLIVEKDPDTIWSLSKQFLKQEGFIIEKSDKNIGIMETNYLENKPRIPSSSLGMIRSFFESTIDNVTYSLPSVDSYKIRIEPINNGEKSEVHLSLSSMAEVITGSGKNESTLWQFKERDVTLEAEMLFKLMVYLGSSAADAREKILSAQKESKIQLSLLEGLNGYYKLKFNYGIEETWDSVSWALNNLKFEIEDRDIKEKAFYINVARTSDKGFFTKMFGDDAVRKIFRISLKSISDKETELIFFDVSEQNEVETKEFSKDLMTQIANQFG